MGSLVYITGAGIVPLVGLSYGLTFRLSMIAAPSSVPVNLTASFCFSSL